MASLLLAGCERQVIEGAVVDVQGAALPGVAVTLRGTKLQTLTDPVGRYALRYEPGNVILLFDKTGYTPGRLEIAVNELRHVRARPVVLWRLPPEKGVYFFANNKYMALGAVEVVRYASEDYNVVYGFRHCPQTTTTDPWPNVMYHDLPRYDVRFCRLQRVEGKFVEFERGTPAWELWTSAEPIDVVTQVIDEPTARLNHLRLLDPLKPGVYAIHWGALDGRNSLDPRAFVFTVEPPQPPETEEPEQDTAN